MRTIFFSTDYRLTKNVKYNIEVISQVKFGKIALII